jgi:hypothetical protein
LTIYGTGGVRQTEMHTAEPFVSKPSAFEVEVAIHKKGDKLSVVIIKAYHCCQLHTKFHPTFFSLG